MSLAFGRAFHSVPGPSVMPDRVLQAMHRPAPNIYEGDLVELVTRIKTDLQAVACTKGEALIYIANGHGGWEAALSNIAEPGDKLLFLATGRFANGWADMARLMGADAEVLDFGTAATVDPQKVEDRLRKDVEQEIRAVLVCQTDTSSSVRNDVAAIRTAMDAVGHPALLCVDCIASLACEPFRMDDWGVDVTVSGSQKGLMTPPGLAFNHISEKAWQARQRVSRTTPYWDWTMRRDPEIFYMNFFGTAPTHHLFGLGEALDMLLREEGLEQVWARHEVHARAVWAAVDTWCKAGPLQANISDHSSRSWGMTTIWTGGADAEALRNWCEKETGLTLGMGLSLSADTNLPTQGLFRIGHMGHLSPPMILGTLATVDAGLKAQGIEHGQGALEAAAAVIADHLRAPQKADIARTG